VITEQFPSVKSVALGFWVDVGSRDEREEFQGCSHFIEHLLFKGTEKRTAQEISTVLESRGGFLDAETDRDMTCYMAWILKEDMGLAVEVISDMIQNPLFEEENIENERQVILEEFSGRNDDPEELIEDLYVETVWKGSQAAHPIIGNREIIENMRRDQILRFFQEHYIPSRTIVLAAGNLEHEKLIEKVEFHFEKDLLGQQQKRDQPKYIRNHRSIERELNQVHICIATEGVAYGDYDKAALELIKAYLGVGTSSRLFQEVREKRGLAYSIEAENYYMKDAGLLAIFASTRKDNAKRVVEICLDELENIRSGIEVDRLKETRYKLVGSLTYLSESTMEVCNQLGISTLRSGRPKTIQEDIKDLETVTPEHLARVADKIFNGNTLSLITVGLNRKEAGTLEAIIA